MLSREGRQLLNIVTSARSFLHSQVRLDGRLAGVWVGEGRWSADGPRQAALSPPRQARARLAGPGSVRRRTACYLVRVDY